MGANVAIKHFYPLISFIEFSNSFSFGVAATNIITNSDVAILERCIRLCRVV